MERRGIITMTDGGIVTMPQHDVWMTVTEIADMFGVLEAIVYRAIRSAYKKRELYEDETMKYIPVPRHKGCHAEVYNLDLILYLTYKIPSRNARIFRRYMTNKAYARNPYEHVCIIIDDVDFKAGIHTQME